MFNSNVLDVAVGLVFIFLLLSLICSAANEIIESFLKQRAANLEKGIQELVGQGKDSPFVTELYNHGLINSLYRGKYEATSSWMFWKRSKLPSYIPARNFALAVLDLRKTAKNLPPNLKSAFDAFEQSSGGDPAKLQRNVEEWFNSSMDRASGWYKRTSQRIVLVMGLVLAVLVNADCIQIAKRLSTNASLRQSVATLADTATKSGAANDSHAAIDRVREDLQTLDSIGLPLGWYRAQGEAPTRFWQAISDHWLGWLLTALAVSLGAPFWFDMLNKIIVIRSTVKPSEKSQPEGSKDPIPPPVPTPLQVVGSPVAPDVPLASELAADNQQATG